MKPIKPNLNSADKKAFEIMAQINEATRKLYQLEAA